MARSWNGFMKPSPSKDESKEEIEGDSDQDNGDDQAPGCTDEEILNNLRNGTHEFKFVPTRFKCKKQVGLTNEELKARYPAAVNLQGIDWVKDVLSVDEIDLRRRENSDCNRFGTKKYLAPTKGVLELRRHCRRLAEMRKFYREVIVVSFKIVCMHKC